MGVEFWLLRLDFCVNFQQFFGSLDFDLRDGEVGGGLCDFGDCGKAAFELYTLAIMFLLQWLNCEFSFINLQLQQPQLRLILRPATLPDDQFTLSIAGVDCPSTLKFRNAFHASCFIFFLR